MAGDGGRADVDREAVGAIAKARPDADDAVAGMDRDGGRPVALAERLLQALQAAQVAGHLAQLPLRAQRLLQPLQVAGRPLHVGLLDLDVVQPDDRVEADLAHLGALADDLLVDLAVRRDVDHHVAQQLGLAGQPAALLHALVARPVALLGRPTAARRARRAS